MKPVISIIMPCFNAERHLAVSIGSVLNQSFGNWELIAVDDGSSDGTFEWLKNQTDQRIRVLTQVNMGVSAARNAGLELCGGEYIAFLDSDDTWAPDFLAKMLLALQANHHAVLAYCGWQNLGIAGGRGLPFIPPDYEGPGKTEALLEGCRWPIHACLTRHSVIRQIGGFDRELRIGEDYLLWMEVAHLGKLARVPEVLAYYHHHDGVQATQNQSRTAVDTLTAKQKFLQHHPEVTQRVGAKRIEAITWGKFIAQANALYWKGDLVNARPLFRKALLAGHGSRREKLRMLPSLLPLGFHRMLSSVKYRV